MFASDNEGPGARVYRREAVMHYQNLQKMMKAHQALLNTLAPSRSPWVKLVHKNASAYFETLKKEFEEYNITG